MTPTRSVAQRTRLPVAVLRIVLPCSRTARREVGRHHTRAKRPSTKMRIASFADEYRGREPKPQSLRLGHAMVHGAMDPSKWTPYYANSNTPTAEDRATGQGKGREAHAAFTAECSVQHASTVLGPHRASCAVRGGAVACVSLPCSSHSGLSSIQQQRLIQCSHWYEMVGML